MSSLSSAVTLPVGQTLSLDEISEVSGGTTCAQYSAAYGAAGASVGFAAGVVAFVPGAQPVALGWGLAAGFLGVVASGFNLASEFGVC